MPNMRFATHCRRTPQYVDIGVGADINSRVPLDGLITAACTLRDRCDLQSLHVCRKNVVPGPLHHIVVEDFLVL